MDMLSLVECKEQRQQSVILMDGQNCPRSRQHGIGLPLSWVVVSKIGTRWTTKLLLQ